MLLSVKMRREHGRRAFSSLGDPETIPRYFFHLHAGESRACPDRTGQRLPDPYAARAVAWRMARQRLAWDLEPVRWLDYHQLQVTDEAGAIVFELPLTEAADQTADGSLRAEGAEASLKGKWPDGGLGLSEQNNMQKTADAGMLGRLGLEASERGAPCLEPSPTLEFREVNWSQALDQKPTGNAVAAESGPVESGIAVIFLVAFIAVGAFLSVSSPWP
jgi:hypothetical protein